MTFILKLKLGNDAMRTAHDVAEALRLVAEALDEGPRDEIDDREMPRVAIRDTNGNRVGHWETVEED